MRGARAWTDETNDARGERNFWPTGGGSVLTESGGVGGPGGVDAAWRRSGRERGGPGTVWSSAAAWRQHGSGPTTASAGGALSRDSGERRGRRDTVDVADRWAGARRGPNRQRLGAAQ
jgi:hypothetical protein